MSVKKFNSPDELDALFTDYIEFCKDNDKMPNISGFCVYCKRYKGFTLHRDTIYEYAKKEEYSDTIKAINDCIEDEVLNSKSQRDLIKLAYLNNKCGYKTSVDIVATPGVPDRRQLQSQLQSLLAELPEEQKQLLLSAGD
jgi:hypothetical protein